MALNVRCISDLHDEFELDGGRAFYEAQDPTGVDVLILGGDITSDKKELAFQILSKKFKNILYVMGNHDFWRSHHQDTIIWAKQLEVKYPGVRVLDNNIVEIQGQRFLGGTLWTPEDKKSKHLERLMNDFWMINGGASQFIYSENVKTTKFLEDNVRDGDVVVTHHLPSWEAISDFWKGNSLNVFFANDLDHILYDKKVVWFHGHSHDSFDKVIGHSRVIRNPRGYTPNGLNRGFRPNMIVEI